jgi:hypothetical protein
VGLGAGNQRVSEIGHILQVLASHGSLLLRACHVVVSQFHVCGSLPKAEEYEKARLLTST